MYSPILDFVLGKFNFRPWMLLRINDCSDCWSVACITNTRALFHFPECSVLTSLLLFIQQGKETQLLHVFEEDLILGNEKIDDYLQDSGRGSFSLIALQRSLCFCAVSWTLVFPSVPSRTLFSARFFLVVMEITQSGRSLLHMWHLQLDAVPAIMGL